VIFSRQIIYNKELSVSEVSHSVFGRYNPELICECGHPRNYHNHIGLSENIKVGTSCNACRCQEFKESVQATQNNVIELRKKIESRKKGVQAQLTVVENELIELQKRCQHPNLKSKSEYDFTAYWCDDCGKNWSGRR